eukprot:993305_1
MTNVMSTLVNKFALVCTMVNGVYASHSRHHSSSGYVDINDDLNTAIYIGFGVVCGALVAGGLVWCYKPNGVNTIAKWLSLDKNERSETLLHMFLDHPNLLAQNPDMLNQMSPNEFDFIVSMLYNRNQTKLVKDMVEIALENVNTGNFALEYEDMLKQMLKQMLKRIAKYGRSAELEFVYCVMKSKDAKKLHRVLTDLEGVTVRMLDDENNRYVPVNVLELILYMLQQSKAQNTKRILCV